MERLKHLRKIANRYQADVAKAIGVSVQSYNHYETGKREPDFDTLVKLCAYFGVTADYLLGNDIKQNGEIKEIPPLKLTKDEITLIDNFCLLNAAGQQRVLEYANDLVASGKYSAADKKRKSGAS
jgi:transcriptional regulator with XRE-family HTH domain